MLSAKGIMNPSFKPYRTGMLTMKEKYSCGCGDGHKGRNHVYYLCQCDCGREVIFSGDEISRHPYSCGCTPKPLEKRKESLASVIGHGRREGTQLCMLKPTRAVYSNSTSGVSGIWYDPKRKKWRARIVLKGEEHFLGYFPTEEEAIKARIEGERKYWDPLFEKWDSIEDNNKEKTDKEEKK